MGNGDSWIEVESHQRQQGGVSINNQQPTTQTRSPNPWNYWDQHNPNPNAEEKSNCWKEERVERENNPTNVKTTNYKWNERTYNTSSPRQLLYHANLRELQLLHGFLGSDGTPSWRQTQCTRQIKFYIVSCRILPGLPQVHRPEEGWCGKSEGIGKASA